MDKSVSNAYPDEISLREIIEIVLRGWKFIAVITVAAVVISALISFFVITPSYEASVTLMASAATKIESPQTKGGVSGFLDSLSGLAMPTLDTYREQVKSPIVLQNVLASMGVKDDALTQRQLAGKITAEIVDNTNLLRIRVRDSEPKLAANIADSVAANFVKYVTELANEQELTFCRYLEKQMDIEKGLLDGARAEYEDFLAQSRSVHELEAEIGSRLNLIADYRVQSMEKEVQENSKRAAFKILKDELETTEKVLVTKRSLSEDALLHSILSNTAGESPEKTGGLSMENQEINPNYLNLEMSIAELKADLASLAAERENIGAQIEQNSIELKSLQREFAEKQHREDTLKRNVSLAKQTYDAFYSKYEEIRIAQTGQTGETNITLTVPAMVPTVPISPNKRLNVAIAGVLGLMLSVFIVFLKDYWEKTSVK